MKPDVNTRYRVKGWPAVAVAFEGYPKRWEPDIFVDEDGNEFEGINGTWVEDREGGRVNVRMVGDDRIHEIDLEDLVPLDDLDYCTECGQIGCAHDGRSRGEG